MKTLDEYFLMVLFTSVLLNLLLVLQHLCLFWTEKCGSAGDENITSINSFEQEVQWNAFFGLGFSPWILAWDFMFENRKLH